MEPDVLSTLPLDAPFQLDGELTEGSGAVPLSEGWGFEGVATEENILDPRVLGPVTFTSCIRVLSLFQYKYSSILLYSHRRKNSKIPGLAVPQM